MMFGFNIWKVKGYSMSPDIPDGSYVLLFNWFGLSPVKSNDRVIMKHKKFGYILKTVVHVDKAGLVWSRRENEHGLKPQRIGPICLSQVKGKVLKVFAPR